MGAACVICEIMNAAGRFGTFYKDELRRDETIYLLREARHGGVGERV